MATLTITIPDAVATRVYTALCVRGSLPVNAANAKTVVIDYIKTVTKHYEGEAAGNTAKATALATADTEIALT